MSDISKVNGAISIIRAFCWEHEYCKGCPFRSMFTDNKFECVLLESPPVEWNMICEED